MATVTYAGPAQFLTSLTWREVQPVLLAQSPLRNLHWKSPASSSIRTIQQLEITLVPLDSVRPHEHTSQIPTTLLDKPLLHIFVFACEETDAETYRTTFKKQIRDWHATVASRKNQDWIIVQVIRSDVRVQSGKLFQLKGSVSDKVKADFNADKRDRCVQLNWSSGNTNPVVWADFTNKLKEGMLLSFGSAVSQREEEVKRSESQRTMPGWNFCTFFILKESLATSFQGIGLFEDALLQYDELEGAFFQVMKDKNMSWFGVLITPSPEDASAPLLSVDKKPYRELILANNISVFDFRIYVLARQCEILAKMGRINEICSKSAAFLEVFGRGLREVEDTLPAFFIEYWRYSSALSVVDHCNTYTSTNPTVKAEHISSDAGKGELLELARHQLDFIGVQLGHLPALPPFSTDAPDGSVIARKSVNGTESMANASFTESITDKERFYDLYTSSTDRAIASYTTGGRKKFALKLYGSLAALASHRGNLDNALSTFTSLPAHYQLHDWISLESFMYSRALDTHATLNKKKDRDWITTTLSFIKTYVNDLGSEALMNAPQKESRLIDLVSAMKQAAETLDSDLTYPDHPVISLKVSPLAQTAEDRDGSYIDVTLHNHLPCAFPIEEVHVILIGTGSERLRYSAPCDTLAPGKTQIQIHCPDPLPGSYILEVTECRMSHILFQWPHWTPNSTIGKHAKTKPFLIRVPADPLSFDVKLLPPMSLELGKERSIMVSIASGRNSITKASLRLSSHGIQFRHRKVGPPQGDDNAHVMGTEDAILVEDIAEHRKVSFAVVHSDTSVSTMTVSIEVAYSTLAEPGVSRTFRVLRKVPIALPLSPFVEDFFSGDKLFSKFTISTTSHQHIQISAAELSPPPDSGEVSITSCSNGGRVVSVTPTQPAIFLFMITSEEGPPPDSLHLRVTFRMLREEIETRIEAAVCNVLNEPRQIRRRIALTSQIILTLEKESSWVALYSQTGELRIPLDLLEKESPDEAEKIKELLLIPPPITSGPWRHITVPVDVPSMNIVASVSLEIVGTPFTSRRGEKGDLPPLYAGEPISAVLGIHASLHWGGSRRMDRKYKLRYDLQEMVNDWLVSGRKRGDIWVSNGENVEIPVTLVALHHGLLSLPQVAVNAQPLVGGEMTMGSVAIPSTFAYQSHGAEKVMILPRSGRSTFIVDLGD